MTKLSERVKKAKELRFTKANGKSGIFNTWGSKDDHYVVKLKSGEKEIVTPDGYLTVKVFYAKCNMQIVNINNPYDINCPVCKGNNKHTVCYHSLGAIWHSFQGIDRLVSFYETYRDANRGLSFGGYIAKIENQNGRGCVWATIRKKDDHEQEEHYIMKLPKNQIELTKVSNLDNVSTRLMRGDDNEGID